MPNGYNWTSSDRRCSCYLPPGATELSQLESTINYNGRYNISLEAPPLRLSVRTSKDIDHHQASYRDVNGTDWKGDVWVRNSSLVANDSYEEIRQSSYCLSDTRYSWGFSLQLVLTFVIYTLFFALALAAMQLEVYWQGHWHRFNQPHSIYSDILAIADSLEAKFGSQVRDLPVRDLDEKISGHRGGVRLQIDSLPLSRQEVHKAQVRAHQAGQKAGQQAGSELENLTPNYGGRASEAGGSLSFATNHSDQNVITTLPRPESGVDESEGRAESPLLGLESEITRIHSRYSSGEDATLLQPGEGSKPRHV
jgi:hypothetical protein